MGLHTSDDNSLRSSGQQLVNGLRGEGEGERIHNKDTPSEQFFRAQQHAFSLVLAFIVSIHTAPTCVGSTARVYSTN